MEEKYHVLIYQDNRKIRFLELCYYSCGSIVLSRPGQELIVNKKERDYLLKLKNGKKPVFGEKKEVEKKEKEDVINGLG